MKCESIVTRVKHDVRGKSRKDSFFLLECDPWENFVLKILGECYVDEESMRNFELWLTSESGSYQLMVSLDYKYARVVEPYLPDPIFVPGEQVLPMLPNEVYGPPVEKLIPALQRELRDSPVEQLRYGMKMNGAKLPKRVGFDGWTVYEFDPYGFLKNFAGAQSSDVALVWNFIAKENPLEDLPGLMDYIHDRIDDGWMNDGDWFNAKGLTFEELDMRRERARIHFERLMDCDTRGFLTREERLTEVNDYLKEITDLSELLELAVLVFERMGESSAKHESSCIEIYPDQSDQNSLWITEPYRPHSEFLICCGTATDHMYADARRRRQERQPKWADLDPAIFRRLGQLISRSSRKIPSPPRGDLPIYLDEEDMQL